MSIENSLDRIATALEAIAGFNQATQTALATVALAAPKRGPGRPPKAVTATANETAAPAATAPAAPVPVVAAPVEHVSTPLTVTKEMLSGALSKLILANKRDTVVKILGEHGATSVSVMAPGEYAAAYAKAVAAVSAE